MRHWAKHLTLSHHGAAFIALEEGVVLHPYYDSRHIVTTGVGHVITPAHRTITHEDIAVWTFSSNKAAVEFFRRHDVVPYVHEVQRTLGETSLFQAQFDMCVSLCFNIGPVGFRGSSVAHYIRMGHMTQAANAFLNWSNPPELGPRRHRERARFLEGHW